MQETKRLHVDYRTLNAQLPTVLQNKSSGVITFVVLSKIGEMFAHLHESEFFTSLDLSSGYYHIKLSPKRDVKVLFLPYCCITFLYQLTDIVVIVLLKAIAEAMSNIRESL